jgi:hypothetical protein
VRFSGGGGSPVSSPWQLRLDGRKVASVLGGGRTERERYGGSGATLARHRPVHAEWKTEEGDPLGRMG